MKLSQISEKKQLPKTVNEIKAPKPKIKLIMEKETFVEDVVKNILPGKNLEMYQSSQVRNSSTGFFKPIDQIIEEKEDDVRPITQSNRKKSAINLGNV